MPNPPDSELNLEVLLQQDGEIPPTATESRLRAEKIYGESGNKDVIPSFVGTFYRTPLFENRLRKEVTELAQEITVIVGDDNHPDFVQVVSNYGGMSSHSIRGGFEEGKRELDRQIQRYSGNNDINTGRLNTKSSISDRKQAYENYRTHSVNFLKDESTIVTDRVALSAREAYVEFVQVNVEQEKNSLLRDISSLSDVEREDVSEVIVNVLEKYYRSDNGIRHVLSQLGGPVEDKKKNLESIPSADLNRIINQTREEYQAKGPKKIKQRIGSREVSTLTERKDEILSALADGIHINGLAIFEPRKLDGEQKRQNLSKLARSYVQAGEVVDLISGSNFLSGCATAERGSKQPTSEWILENMAEDPDLINYVEGRILLFNLQATLDAHRTNSTARDKGPYYISNSERHERITSQIETLLVTLLGDSPSVIYKRLANATYPPGIVESVRVGPRGLAAYLNKFIPSCKQDGDTESQAALIEVRDYFGKRLMGDDYEAEKVKLDASLENNGTKSVQLPENITAGELKEKLSEAQGKLETLSRQMENLPNQPVSQIAALSSEYSNTSKEVAVLLRELQNRL